VITRPPAPNPESIRQPDAILPAPSAPRLAALAGVTPLAIPARECFNCRSTAATFREASPREGLADWGSCETTVARSNKQIRITKNLFVEFMAFLSMVIEFFHSGWL
jgi:hypothetical protein